MDENRIREIIREELNSTMANVFSKHIQLLDGRNIQLGKTTGTKIGLDATSKISVYGATPVVRAEHIADPTGGGTQDTQARVAVNSILVALENFGLLKTS